MTTTPISPAAAGLSRTRRVSDGSSKAPVPYDFTQPIQLSREQIRVIQIAFDAFARQATTAFTSVLRAQAVVERGSIDQMSYAEYVASLETETHMTLLDTDPLPGQAVIEMPIPSVMLCMDYMLGGVGADRQPKRPLSEIETRVASILVEDRLAPALRSAMRPIVDLSLTVRGTESSPQFTLASSTADVMVVGSFTVTFHRHRAKLTVALPYSGLNAHLTRAAQTRPTTRAEQLKAEEFSRALGNVCAEVAVELKVATRSTTMTPTEVSALKVGDVISLNHPSAAPFQVQIDGHVVGQATIGVKGKKAAARIVHIDISEEAAK